MNLKQHANRYYKSLCTCQYPAPSKFARDICAWCGGIVPRWRMREVERAEERRASLFWTFVAILALTGALVLDRMFPGVLDGAINQIGR